MRIDVPIAAEPGRAYPIIIGPEAPGAIAATLLPTVLSPNAKRLLVVSDDNVAPLYAADFAAALAARYHVVTHVIPAGEGSKTLDTLGAVLDAAFAAGLARSDALLALGGGVVGDVAGFAAAVFQRGVDLVQVPTTLLAQVDSSVGGKTGVNHARGKNLIGAFWPARAVIASQAVLATLAPREIRCGLSEAAKHAILADPALLSDILRDAAVLGALEPIATARLVYACVTIKAAVVAADPREDPIDGRRAILNFGHTFGHAYEKLLGYGTWTHGEAVALGMVLAARLSERLGYGADGVEHTVREVLARLGLPYEPDDPGLPGIAALVEAARGDKKGDATEVRFVLLRAIGNPYVRRLRWDDIATLLTAAP